MQPTATIQIAFHNLTPQAATRLIQFAQQEGYNTSATGGVTDEETTTTKTTTKKAKKTGPTLEDVVEALRTYAESESREEAIKIMKKTAGVTTVAKLDEDQYQDVIDALAID